MYLLIRHVQESLLLAMTGMNITTTLLGKSEHGLSDNVGEAQN